MALSVWACGPDCPVCNEPDPDLPPGQRAVPEFSGEGAIYTPEYLARREGNASGTDPDWWREMSTNY